jgi:hypothetical protein
MTTNDIERQFTLIDASRKIATIYTHYGHIQAAQKELIGLGKLLQTNNQHRRVCE